jgi:hypothetical protein
MVMYNKFRNFIRSTENGKRPVIMSAPPPPQKGNICEEKLRLKINSGKGEQISEQSTKQFHHYQSAYFVCRSSLTVLQLANCSHRQE